MTDEMKLHLALVQIDNLSQLFEGNEFEQFLHNKLVGIEVEVKRQLSNLRKTDGI
jgi:hypothetical protein